jgi:hypothetical protein
MLNEQQIQKVRSMMQSSGWTEVLVPLVAGRGSEFTKIALRMPANRAEPYKDVDDRDAMNHIRGRIEEIKWVLEFFVNEINVHDFNARNEQTQTNGADLNAVQPPA